MTKPTKWHVHPAKTQVSLGIRPVWSESSLSAWRKLGSFTHWAHSKDSDQSGRMPRLIWVFIGHTVILLILSRGGSFLSAKIRIRFGMRRTDEALRGMLQMFKVHYQSVCLFIFYIHFIMDTLFFRMLQLIKIFNLKLHFELQSFNYDFVGLKASCGWYMSHLMTKPTKLHVRLAKTQIRPVWSVFAVRMKKAQVLSYPLSIQRRLWSDWADAQADWVFAGCTDHFVMRPLICCFLNNGSKASSIWL